ncbi:hypothetical protein J2128_001116 [Methanomicrobium sp. W14]|uniref:hypothetical protein n=1 Tax=Methanomicrobium sp. W14 TaxID=2817839 RepID=UPI001AE40DF0|nr:hypothetical protein [Methanomicrobium sp. W14]MBP2133195.1 hypothetical protein [Methanomicrobium sp. W14]
MNSRYYDLLSLIGAVVIVVIIAFVMKPGFFTDSSGGQNVAQGTHNSGYLDNESAFSPVSPVNYTVADLYSKENRKWTLASRISSAMDYYEPTTRNFAAGYVSKENSGDFTIAQACDIWDNSVSDWTYEYQKYGIWDVTPASSSINKGLTGDSNDFAVLVASLIKAVGGQARIKLAQSQNGGDHAYAELYLGDTENYNTPMINTTALSMIKEAYPFAFSNDPYGINIFKYKYGAICQNNGVPSSKTLENLKRESELYGEDVGELYGNFLGMIFGDDENFFGNYTSELEISENKTGNKNSDSCWYYVRPLELIMNNPDKYADICYQYPKLIEYLLMAPDTNEIEFQIMYIEMRYGDYNPGSTEVRTLRNIPYTSDIESDGDRGYWLRLEMSGNYPGDTGYVDSRYATVFYSDASWDDITYSTFYG